MNTTCLSGQSSYQGNRARIEPSLFGEVTFGNPDRRETMPVGVFCAFCNQLIDRGLLPSKLSFAARKKDQTKIDQGGRMLRRQSSSLAPVQSIHTPNL